MKHCPKCNLDFPDAYKFCGSCGGAVSDSRRGPGCGELVALIAALTTKDKRSLAELRH